MAHSHWALLHGSRLHTIPFQLGSFWRILVKAERIPIASHTQLMSWEWEHCNVEMLASDINDCYNPWDRNYSPGTDPATPLRSLEGKKTLVKLMTQWEGLPDSFVWPWPLCSKYSNVPYPQILLSHHCIYHWIFETHCLKWIKYIAASLLWVKCMISSTTMTSKHFQSSAYARSILWLGLHISVSHTRWWYVCP